MNMYCLDAVGKVEAAEAHFENKEGVLEGA